jgi:histidine triad (HIT) family protein
LVGLGGRALLASHRNAVDAPAEESRTFSNHPATPMTLFEKIIAREIPATILHEDDLCLAFKDINPGAPIHFLVIPRKPIPRIAEATAEDQSVLGHLLLTAGRIARDQGFAADGFRLVINNGPHGGETVPHLHVHVLAGRPLDWPPG